MQDVSNTYFSLESPLYSIHQYQENLFKVVAFKGSRSSIKMYVDEHEHYDNKLAAAFSRARSLVLQYGLCNEWKWFFTGTIDKDKFDRYDLDTYYSSLSQWIRDERKRTKSQISFLLIPEQHKRTKGTWHIHGMIGNLPDSETELFTKNTRIPGRKRVPKKLIDGGYYNWPRYQEKFGFCSLGLIRDPIATAFYVSKYVSKDLSERSGDVGKHLYFHSRPLKKAQKASDIYCPSVQLDKICEEHDYQFCKVGMVQAPWDFPYRFEGADFDVIDLNAAPVEEFDPATIDPFYEQMEIRL